jgi:alkylation response protein AidB-like acyl-CoA dehydrogenase
MRREGDAYVLSGVVETAPYAAHTDLLALVLADGAAWWLVPTDTAGITLGPAAPDLGVHGSPPARLALDAIRLPVSDKPSTAPRLLAAQDVGAAAAAVGVGQAAFEAALRYSQQRSTFGKPICQHQAVQLALADMATRMAAARLLVGNAAERLESGDVAPAHRARAFAAEAAVAVTLAAMRVHGGYGYTTEFPVERYYRDAASLLAAG